jgi:Protein of unknown function DUF262./Protein of unknown function (DUF1524).
MANTIKLYSISELLERNFFIPSYQRGYRWDKQQVDDLLNDIYSFAIKSNKSEKEFYCLQPVVVKKINNEVKLKNKLQSEFDNNIWYEVIDGQQRLTTIRILISYLVCELYPGKTLYEKHRKSPFKIEYETRKDCNSFIENNVESDDTIDFYFITEARKSIQSWFNNPNNIKDPQKAKEKIRNTLIYNKEDQDQEGIVQVIWYEIENTIEDTPENSSKAIDTFIRINLGKIPLTNSELIKALFLQEREFYKGKENENEIAKLKQLQISTEWDRIENALQNDDFWWFINENENKTPARIDFIFNLIKEIKVSKDQEVILRKSKNNYEIEQRIITNPTIEERIGTDNNSTFRYFYQEFDKQIDFNTLKKEWDTIKHYYFTLEEWYNNPVWYHYIGFLIFCGVSILEIYNLTKADFETKEEIKTKKGITLSLKKRIKYQLRNVKWEFDSNNVPFLDISYNGDKKFIRELLLLYNIEYITKQCDAKTLIFKFPFKTFKEIKDVDGNKMSWDIEHIDSFNSNKLPNRNTRVVWLQFALDEIEDNDLNADLILKIKDYIQNEKSRYSFEELQPKVVDIIKETENDEDLKNSIGNLTLLDAGTNRGYGNALFPTKRKKIIEKDRLGVFIPICTKNVFLKYFDKTGAKNIKWSNNDILNYRNDISNTLEVFLPEKPLNTNENE